MQVRHRQTKRTIDVPFEHYEQVLKHQGWLTVDGIVDTKPQKEVEVEEVKEPELKEAPKKRGRPPIKALN